MTIVPFRPFPLGSLSGFFLLDHYPAFPMKPLFCLLFSVTLIGCSSEKRSADTGLAETSMEVVPEKDDAEVVAALVAIGAKTKTNGDGLIIEVNLRETEATDDTLKVVAGLKNVKSLLLNDLNITDAGLEALKTVEWPIANLDLRGCAVTNAGLDHVKGLSTLKALRLSGSNSACSVDDTGMASVAEFKNLKVLSLDKLWISDEGIEQLAGLERLEELYLAGTTIGDDAIGMIARLPNIRKLRLSGNQISNDGLALLTAATNLVELDLSEVRAFTDDGLAHLCGLTNLTKLNLWRSPLTDDGMPHLKPLVNLEWLNLDNTMLTDAGVPALSGMGKLTFLHLGSTLVTNDCLTHLSGLTALKDLKVTRTSVDEAGVAELQKSLPDTDIQLLYLDN